MVSRARSATFSVVLAAVASAACQRSASDAAPRPAATTSASADLVAPAAHPRASSARDASLPLPPAIADAPDAGGVGSPSPWPAALAKPVMPAPAPIKITGYPKDVATCLPDPAEHAGFTKDGEELGYCAEGMFTRCELVDRAGKTRSMSSKRNGDSPDGDPKKAREIAAFLKSSGMPALKRGDCVLAPPPLDGSWPYSDITVNVLDVAATYKKGAATAEDTLVSQPLVRIGGTVAGEPPVYPTTYSPPHRKLSPPASGEIPYNTTEVNSLTLSPDGKEMGVVIHAYCMEWCDDYQVVRMPASRFASLVYNDAGFASYRKGQLDRAAELFTKAAFVDDARELPAYNLACTYAKKSDPRAEAALALAIARGGEPVKARAVKDKDFDAVRAAPWFVKATGAAK